MVATCLNSSLRAVIERHVKSTANALAPYKHHALKASKGIIA
jgi:hypothetical protein